MIQLKDPSVEFVDSFFPAMAEFEVEGRPQVPAEIHARILRQLLGANAVVFGLVSELD